MPDLGTAIASISATFNVLKGAMAARDEHLISNAQMELQQKLNDALAMTLTHIQTTHALELEAQKLRAALVQADAQQKELEAKLEKRAHYELSQPALGKWAYTLVGKRTEDAQRTTYFCAACYAQHLEVPLQHVAAGPGSSAMLRCPNSPKHALSLGGALPGQPQRVTHSEGFGRDW